jgi:hypothetical protein
MTTNSERICPWTRIRQAIGRSSGMASLPLGRSLAVFITNIAGCSYRQGQDVAKSVFQVHGIDAAGLRRQMRRSHVLKFFAAQAPWVVGVSTAVTIQVDEGIFIGAEAHYLRIYDGLGFDVFDSDALFVGPTAYARLSDNFAISAAWSLQVTCQALDAPGLLNLRDFERHQARLRFEYTF